MNSTQPIGQKQTGRLAEARMLANTMPADMRHKRAPTASTSKAIGLSDDMINAIGEEEDLQYLIKLHSSVQKVKSSNGVNSTKITELSTLFKEMHEMIERVQKA